MDRDRRKALLSIPLFASALPALAGAGALPDRTLRQDEATHAVESYGETWLYFEGATAQLSAFVSGCVKLNGHAEPHPPHTHADEEMMLVTEGSGEISIGGEAKRVGAGSMMYCAGGRVHGIRNTAAAPLVFYFWKWRK
jgi:mannose-6-phosphate isomerase-like protein (cupin superfamily)